jgi:hypothetical protein
MELQLHVFLTLAVDGGERSASSPDCIIPHTHWIGGWVGLGAGMNTPKTVMYIKYEVWI